MSTHTQHSESNTTDTTSTDDTNANNYERDTEEMRYGDEYYTITVFESVFGGLKYECPLDDCDKSCKNIDGIRQHFSQSHGLDSTRHSYCPQCGDRFTQSANGRTVTHCSPECGDIAKQSSE